MMLFNPFRNKIKKRLYFINNKVLPQILLKREWIGINEKGETYYSLDNQVRSCGFNTIEEAERFLKSIQIKEYNEPK